MTAYATRADVYKFGLARGTLGSSARLVSSSLAATDVLTLEDHGFETNDELLLRAVEGGTLSAPLVAGTAYYAIRLTDSTFKLATSAGGSAINLTGDGTNMMVSIALPFGDVLEYYSRFVDAFLPAHLVPLESPYPVTVVAIVAELAAKKLQAITGHTSVSVNEAEVGAKAQLERFAKGLPVRDVRAATSSNKAVTSTLVSTADPRGWAPTGRIP